MKVLVTGAAGWVGRALVPELIAHGHEVVAFVRSDSSAEASARMGAQVVQADMTDAQVLSDAVADVDGVVHLAFNHDFSDFEGAVAQDAAVITTIGEALVDTNKPFVITGGTPAIPGAVATESDSSEFGPAAMREANSTLALSFAQRGVRASVVRLPRSVHGVGDSGFVPQMAAIGKTTGMAGYVGDGEQRWPAVHVADAASLYRLALENGSAGSRYHAVGDDGVSIRQIAEAIGARLDLPVGPVKPEPYGFLGMLMSMDQPSSATKTRAELGWAPTHPSLLEDLADAEYLADV